MRQKILYQGGASGLFQQDNFAAFMSGKGSRITYENTLLRKTEVYVVEPAVILRYEAWRRIIPRGMELWDAKVILSGFDISEAEHKLEALLTVTCFE